jgi:hypothetical protein
VALFRSSGQQMPDEIIIGVNLRVPQYIFRGIAYNRSTSQPSDWSAG